MRVGIVGATGQAGGAMVTVLEERKFPLDELHLFASSRSAGATIAFRDERCVVRDVATEGFAGFDLVLLSQVTHAFGPGENRDLLRRCYRALVPSGRIVIHDFILEEDKTAPKWAALFSLNMLVGTERGASYSESEYAAWLRETGFQDVSRVRLPGLSGLIVGRA